MNKLKISDLKQYKDFINIHKQGFDIYFSNAENNRSFNRSTEEGINELQSLKKEFYVNDVAYVKQIHSDIIYEYNDNTKENFINNEGDGIITNVKNTIIGVFTADCVPVIIVDKKNKVSAAVHSGWRGTISSITKKTIQKMIDDYSSNVNDIEVYIGPHIRKCCYEVSEELKQRFVEETKIPEDVLFNNRNLSMEECILKDLRELNVPENSINSIDLCTYCSNEIRLHSYRKSDGAYGRMFAFIILK